MGKFGRVTYQKFRKPAHKELYISELPVSAEPPPPPMTGLLADFTTAEIGSGYSVARQLIMGGAYVGREAFNVKIVGGGPGNGFSYAISDANGFIGPGALECQITPLDGGPGGYISLQEMADDGGFPSELQVWRIWDSANNNINSMETADLGVSTPYHLLTSSAGVLATFGTSGELCFVVNPFWASQVPVVGYGQNYSQGFVDATGERGMLLAVLDVTAFASIVTQFAPSNIFSRLSAEVSGTSDVTVFFGDSASTLSAPGIVTTARVQMLIYRYDNVIGVSVNGGPVVSMSAAAGALTGALPIGYANYAMQATAFAELACLRGVSPADARVAAAVANQLAFWDIPAYVPPPPAVYALDSIGTADIRLAAGMRRLFSSWTGPLVNLRSTTTGNIVDVYANPTSGYIDATSVVDPTTWGATLGDFITGDIGVGNGQCPLIYDQSGNGRHLEQTTLSSQPGLVISGVLQEVAGSPGKTAVSTTSYRTLWGNVSQPNAFTSGLNNAVVSYVGSLGGNSGALFGFWDFGNNDGSVPSSFRGVVNTFNARANTNKNNVGAAPTVNTLNVRRVFNMFMVDATQLIHVDDGGTAGSTSFAADPTFLPVNRIGWFTRVDGFGGGGNTGGFAETLVVAEPADPATFQTALRAALL